MRLFVFFAIASVGLYFQVRATPTEEAALLQLKQKWAPSSVKVRSWEEGLDPCLQLWPGVVCTRNGQIGGDGSGCQIADPNCLVVVLTLALEGLTGEIPDELGDLENLARLDLHGNAITGEVSGKLRDAFSKISVLDLSSNYLNGTVPRGRQSANWGQNCFVGNKGCEMAPQMRSLSECKGVTSVSLQSCGTSGGKRRTPVIITSAILSICAVGIAFLVHFLMVRAKRRSVSDGVELPKYHASSSPDCKHFTYQELDVATHKFSEAELLGSGGFGLVFKGDLQDGTHVAVKRLEKGSTQGEVEFWNEVLIIGTIQHPNVVTLRGYCKPVMGSEQILVYDYMPNGSVLDALLDDREAVFPWERRFRVAVGVASGLEYLHEKCSPKIIHRDIKPSNILLDENYNARIADFGLAKLALTDQSDFTTIVVGTQGFLDPEYALTGKLTDKSDVFSYGMLLFVLISGRCTMETEASQRPSTKQRVSEWMQVLAKEGELSELVDPRLKGTYDRNQMSRCAQVAMMCTRMHAETRPSMGEVRSLLQGLSGQPPPIQGMVPGLVPLRKIYSCTTSPSTLSPQLTASCDFTPLQFCHQSQPTKSPFSPDYDLSNPSPFSPRPNNFTSYAFSPMFSCHGTPAQRYTRFSALKESPDEMRKAESDDFETPSDLEFRNDTFETPSDLEFRNDTDDYMIGR